MCEVMKVECLSVTNSDNTVEDLTADRKLVCVNSAINRRCYLIDNVRCSVEHRIITTTVRCLNGIDYEKKGSSKSTETRSYEIDVDSVKMDPSKVKPFLDRLAIMQAGEEIWCRATFDQRFSRFFGLLVRVDDKFVA